MIEDEVFTILRRTGETNELNSLVDQFRAGRDPNEVLRLLFSENDELVRIGAYITNEISTKYYDTEAFIDRLYELTNHQVPRVRHYSLAALFPLLSPTCQRAHDLVVKLLNDLNEGVRLAAELTARRLGIVE
jgi:HEAT repeat protein